MKRELKPFPLIHPTTIVLVGTMMNGKANFTTIGDIAVAGLNPPLVMISLHKNHQATSAIIENSVFSINMTTSSMMKQVDYAGAHSGKTTDKSSLFEHVFLHNVPLIRESPIQLIVTPLQKVEVKQRVIFICEVQHTYLDEDNIRDQKIDLSTIKPLLYGLDNRYYTGIEAIGIGYEESE